MRCVLGILLGLCLLSGCFTAGAKASAGAGTLNTGLNQFQVKELLGKPDKVTYVSPNIEEWNYLLTKRPPHKPGQEPRLPSGEPIRYPLVVRFENGEVVAWRTP
jgi:hypothetical protein